MRRRWVWEALLPTTFALALLVGASSPASGVAGFGDVADERFYTKAVQWMVDQRITTGTSPTCFSPEDPVTRGQAALFLWRLKGTPSAPRHSFIDVVSETQEPAVSWLFASGLTTGTTPVTYSPNDYLTRGQLAALLHRLAGEPAASGHRFTDVTAAWQQAPVAWMVENDITEGTSPTRFSPNAAATRGQMAAFLYRFEGQPPAKVDPAHPVSPACKDQTPPPEPPCQTCSYYLIGDSRFYQIALATPGGAEGHGAIAGVGLNPYVWRSWDGVTGKRSPAVLDPTGSPADVDYVVLQVSLHDASCSGMSRKGPWDCTPRLDGYAGARAALADRNVVVIEGQPIGDPFWFGEPLRDEVNARLAELSSAVADLYGCALVPWQVMDYPQPDGLHYFPGDGDVGAAARFARFTTEDYCWTRE